MMISKIQLCHNHYSLITVKIDVVHDSHYHPKKWFKSSGIILRQFSLQSLLVSITIAESPAARRCVVSQCTRRTCCPTWRAHIMHVVVLKLSLHSAAEVPGSFYHGFKHQLLRSGFSLKGETTRCHIYFRFMYLFLHE